MKFSAILLPCAVIAKAITPTEDLDLEEEAQHELQKRASFNQDLFSNGLAKSLFKRAVKPIDMFSNGYASTFFKRAGDEDEDENDEEEKRASYMGNLYSQGLANSLFRKRYDDFGFYPTLQQEQEGEGLLVAPEDPATEAEELAKRASYMGNLYSQGLAKSLFKRSRNTNLYNSGLARSFFKRSRNTNLYNSGLARSFFKRGMNTNLYNSGLARSFFKRASNMGNLFANGFDASYF